MALGKAPEGVAVALKGLHDRRGAYETFILEETCTETFSSKDHRAVARAFASHQTPMKLLGASGAGISVEFKRTRPTVQASRKGNTVVEGTGQQDPSPSSPPSSISGRHRYGTRLRSPPGSSSAAASTASRQSAGKDGSSSSMTVKLRASSSSDSSESYSCSIAAVSIQLLAPIMAYNAVEALKLLDNELPDAVDFGLFDTSDHLWKQSIAKGLTVEEAADRAAGHFAQSLEEDAMWVTEEGHKVLALIKAGLQQQVTAQGRSASPEADTLLAHQLEEPAPLQADKATEPAATAGDEQHLTASLTAEDPPVPVAAAADQEAAEAPAAAPLASGPVLGEAARTMLLQRVLVKVQQLMLLPVQQQAAADVAVGDQDDGFDFEADISAAEAAEAAPIYFEIDHGCLMRADMGGWVRLLSRGLFADPESCDHAFDNVHDFGELKEMDQELRGVIG